MQTSPTNHGICPAYDVSPETVEEAVSKVLNLPLETLQNMGQTARHDFLRDDQEFKNNLKDLLN
jgi:hypothetical protein